MIRGRRTLALLVVAILLSIVAVNAGVLRKSRQRESVPTVCIDPAGGLAQVAQLELLLRSSINCIMSFANVTTSWAGWTDPWFLHTPFPSARYAGWLRAGGGKRRLVVTLGLVPADVPADWRQIGAEGGYDSYARQLGRTLVQAGLAGVTIRLAPEANDGKGIYGIGTSAVERRAWRRYWARVALTLKATPRSHFLLDWTVNAAVQPVRFSDYYPGARAVDIIGIDSYDVLANGRHVPVGPTRWRDVTGQTAGLDQLVTFARHEHKPFSVPEWGNVGPPVTGGGGDDPYYVQEMAQLFKSQDLSYESYFDKAEGGTLTLEATPESLRAYRRDVVGIR